MKKLTLLMAAALTAGVGTAAMSSDDPKWGTYGNSRYGYTLCYPMHLVTPEPESDNGDGRIFVGRNDASIRVWGASNAETWTIKRAMNWRMDQFRKDGGKISYKKRNKDNFVFSGTRDGMILYHKGILEHGQWRSVELSYKPADRKIWDPVVTRVAGCLDEM